jgi:alanine-glyoxylate transaminase/serine-glyoxylate transaminase/serine-pyruvate transaminase
MSRRAVASRLLSQGQSCWRSLSTSAAVEISGRPGEVTPPISNTHQEALSGKMVVPERLLMGPGPSNAHPAVLAAQTLPLLGHLHPPFLKIMDDIQEGLRYVFQTDSPYTLLASGTGHAGMETCISNLLEPGEKIVVGNNGIWGSRVADMAGRYGAEVVDLKVEGGRGYTFEELKTAVETHKPAVLFLCQGESSTGVHQNLAGVGDLCKRNGTLLLVDTVCSLGGVPLYADAWGIDAIYSGSQKVLGAPPGAAPLFLSERALEKVQNRKTKPTSYSMDLNLVGDYWGWFGKRSYHATGTTSTWYAMREALAITTRQGLEKLWSEHRACHEQLWEGLSKMGLEPYVENPDERLVTVNTIKVPEGVDFMAVIKNAMDVYNVEISGGLGPSAGKVWRVGIMGHNARPANIALVLEAFKDGLQKQGKL